MKEIKTEILINTNPSRVWHVLEHTDQYPEWNPLIYFVHGELSPGKTAQIRIYLPGKKPAKFNVHIKKVAANHVISWIGHVYKFGLLDAEHIFELMEINLDTTKFIHKEIYTGLLGIFITRKISTNIRQGFESMNTCLKNICEGD